MKNDQEISNIIKNKKSFFVTNRLIEQKEKRNFDLENCRKI